MDIYDNPKSIDIDGNAIAYYRSGKGEPIVFVHGIMTYSFIWRKMIPFLSPHYDIILIDLLGSGASAIPLNEDLSLKRQAHMIYKVCLKLGLKRVHMVCHDVGGGIGQIFSVHYPQMLFDLTLINSVAYNFWPVQPIIAMRTPIVRQIAMASLDFGMLELIVKRGVYHKEQVTDELMEFFKKPLHSPLGRKGFLHFTRCLDNTNLTEIETQLRKLEVPVLIVRGEADVYLDGSICEKLHFELPCSKLVKIETGGHFIQEDEPQKVSEAILEFIKEKV